MKIQLAAKPNQIQIPKTWVCTTNGVSPDQGVGTDATAAADTAAVAKKIDPAQPPADGVDAELVARLVEQARAAGVQLTGDGGLL